MTGTVATTRELELADALAAVRARLTAAAEAAGRNENEIELLPITKFFPAADVSILHHLGCDAFGESREQEASNKAAEVSNILGGAPIRWHMVGRIQRNKARSIAGWAYAAHSVDSARVIDALDRGATRALAEGDRTAPLRVYIQVSLDGDEERGGVDVGRTRGGRRVVRRGPGRRGPGVRRPDGDSAVGSGRGRGLRTFAIRARAGTAQLSAAPRAVCRDVERPRGGGQTRLDVCACRYRAIGATSSNVTMSSHSSHIFITDTRATGMRRVER